MVERTPLAGSINTRELDRVLDYLHSVRLPVLVVNRGGRRCHDKLVKFSLAQSGSVLLIDHFLEMPRDDRFRVLDLVTSLATPEWVILLVSAEEADATWNAFPDAVTRRVAVLEITPP